MAKANEVLPRRPVIRQLARVLGKNIVLRNVQVEDADFILSLRLDPQKGGYLSPVEADVEKQRQWIRRYLASEGQAYFLICDPAMQPLGTVRIYDAIGDSFSWGSWILKKGAPAGAAVESAVLVYWLATHRWGFRAAHFQVRRDNTSVLAFHEKFGAERVTQTSEEMEIHLRIGQAQIERSLQRYARYLPSEVIVQ
jgi:RimJ/RimL family protein N-acetyltransferase